MNIVFFVNINRLFKLIHTLINYYDLTNNLLKRNTLLQRELNEIMEQNKSYIRKLVRVKKTNINKIEKQILTKMKLILII